jgi:hypothetical protein
MTEPRQELVVSIEPESTPPDLWWCIDASPSVPCLHLERSEIEDLPSSVVIIETPPSSQGGTSWSELFLFIAAALGTLMFAAHLVAESFLVYLYGWSTVWQQRLHFVDMPKGRPWPISNGDLMTDGFFLHYLITAALWLPLVAVTYPALRWLLLQKPFSWTG